MISRISTVGAKAVVAAAALALAGCGGDGGEPVETTARPTLPRSVAEDLAARSDAVADALDAGDVCTAAVRADELLGATVAAINRGDVPTVFQEDLTARANELVNSVNCPPPAPPPTTTEEDAGGGDDGRGKGRNKKKEKDKKDKKDDSPEEPMVTIPTVTETVP
jgi:hypothetical protein